MTRSKELTNACDRVQVQYVLLVEEEAVKLWNAVEGKFAKKQPGWLWERLIDSSGFRDDTAWRDIEEFVHGLPVYVFYDLGEYEDTVLLQDSKRLSEVLFETAWDDYYIANQSLDYLISFNHHHYIIGAGTAKPWVEALLRSKTAH